MDHHNPQDIYYADGERVTTADNESGEALIHQFCAHFGVNAATAMEMFEWLEINNAGPRDESGPRQAILLAMKKWKGICESINNFKADREFAFDCGLLALGFTEVLGVNTQAELAQRWRCCRENVRKLVQSIQIENDLPPIPGQREEEAREHMSEARIKQLK